MASLAVSEDAIPFGVGEDLFKSRRKIVQPQEVRSQLRRRGVFCFILFLFARLVLFPYKHTCMHMYSSKRNREAGCGRERAAMRVQTPAGSCGSPASPLPALAEGPCGRNRRGVRGDSADSRTSQPRAEGKSLTRDARGMAAASTPSTASRKVGTAAGTRPPHPGPTGPPTALHAIHPPSPHPSSPLHLSLRLLIATSTARSLSLAPGPPPSQHSSLATIRPTCRRGHFSTGPRLQLFKEEMSFRCSLSRVPALLSFPWPMEWPVHPAPPLALEFRVLIGQDARKAPREM